MISSPLFISAKSVFIGSESFLADVGGGGGGGGGGACAADVPLGPEIKGPNHGGVEGGKKLQ